MNDDHAAPIIVALFGLTFLLFLLNYNYKYDLSQVGTHKAYITAYQSNLGRGLTEVRTGSLYAKDSLGASNEDVYCVDTQDKALVDKISTLLEDNSQVRTIRYRNIGGSNSVWISECLGWTVVDIN